MGRVYDSETRPIFNFNIGNEVDYHHKQVSYDKAVDTYFSMLLHSDKYLGKTLRHRQ